VPWPFGHPLTFRELLDCLRDRTDCKVVLHDDEGLYDPHTRGYTGQIFYVERTNEQDELWFDYIEVFHSDVAILPDRLRDICRNLGLPEDQLKRRNH
jgi:hypothetical protein